jgi:hypothetical protein
MGDIELGKCEIIHIKIVRQVTLVVLKLFN